MEENNANVEEAVKEEAKKIASDVESKISDVEKEVKKVAKEIELESIPEKYRPISTWGYFGYEVLFAIPVIGFIVLIILAVGGTSNINLRNLARSKFCMILIVLVLLGIAFIIAGTTALLENIPNFRFSY